MCQYESVQAMVEDVDWFSLSDGEEVIWWGRPRLWRIWPSVARSAVSALALLALAVVGPRFAPAGIPDIAVTGAGVVLALLSLKPGVAAYLETRNVHYVLTNRNVYEKTGVWSTTVVRVGVASVQNTRLTKDVWGNLFDYGSVVISTAGSRGADVTFSDLRDPESCRDELQRLMSETRAQSRPVDSRAGQLDADAVDRLTDEVRGMRAAAERLESEVRSG